jgi:hypothetical protein
LPFHQQPPLGWPDLEATESVEGHRLVRTGSGRAAQLYADDA